MYVPSSFGNPYREREHEASADDVMPISGLVAEIAACRHLRHANSPAS